MSCKKHILQRRYLVNCLQIPCENAFRECDAYPLGQANVQLLVSKWSTLWSLTNYEVSESSWNETFGRTVWDIVLKVSWVSLIQSVSELKSCSFSTQHQPTNRGTRALSRQTVAKFGKKWTNTEQREFLFVKTLID